MWEVLFIRFIMEDKDLQLGRQLLSYFIHFYRADRNVCIWNESRNGFEIHSKYIHSSSVQCVAYNPISEIVVSGATKELNIWSADVDKVKTVKVNSKVLCVGWTSDGTSFAAGMYDGTISIRTASGAEQAKIQREAPVWCLKWNPFLTQASLQETLVVGCWDQTITLYSLFGKQIGKSHNIECDPLSISFSGNGDYFYVGDTKCTISIWAREGVKLETLKTCSDWTHAVDVRPKSQNFVLGTEDGYLEYNTVVFPVVHGLYQDRYAFRDLMTDVIVQHLVTEQRVRIRCRDYVKKIAVFNGRLAVQLNKKVYLYEVSIEDSHDLQYKVFQQIRKSFECALLVVTSQHLVLCQERRLKLLSFNGDLVREWSLDGVVRYIKVIGGPPGRECLIAGLRNGGIFKIFIDNPFPVPVVHHSKTVKCLDLSKSRNLLAVVDSEDMLSVYRVDSQQLVYTEPNANSVAWNTEMEEMIAFSGTNNQLSIKAGVFLPHVQRMVGFIVGFKGSKLFWLHHITMRTIDVPQSVTLRRYIELRDFKTAYEVGCLGVTEVDWRLLGTHALVDMDFIIARKSFTRVRDIRYLDLVIRAESFVEMRGGLDKLSDADRCILLAEVFAFQGKFDDAVEMFIAGGQGNLAISLLTELRMWDRADALAKRIEVIEKNPQVALVDPSVTLMKLGLIKASSNALENAVAAVEAAHAAGAEALLTDEAAASLGVLRAPHVGATITTKQASSPDTQPGEKSEAQKARDQKSRQAAIEALVLMPKEASVAMNATFPASSSKDDSENKGNDEVAAGDGSIQQSVWRKRALEAEVDGDLRGAADMFLKTGQVSRAIRIYIRILAYPQLMDALRQLPPPGQKPPPNQQETSKSKHSKNQQQNLVTTSLELHNEALTCFRQGRQFAFARETASRLGDVRSLVTVLVEGHAWAESFAMCEQYPELRHLVFLPWAELKVAAREFESAIEAFCKAGRRDQARLLLAKLAHAAVNEERFRLAARHILRLARLELEDVDSTFVTQSDYERFYSLRLRALIYYAYATVKADTTSSIFTTSSSTTCFNAACYVWNILASPINSAMGSKQQFLFDSQNEGSREGFLSAAGSPMGYPFRWVPRGISPSVILLAIGHHGFNLGAYRTARQALERLNRGSVSASITLYQRHLAEALLLQVKGKEFKDSDNLLPTCARCLTQNPIIRANGDCCNSCNHPLFRSYLGFDCIPVVEFDGTNHLSPAQITALINITPETSLPSTTVEDEKKNLSVNQKGKKKIVSSSVTGVLSAEEEAVRFLEVVGDAIALSADLSPTSGSSGPISATPQRPVQVGADILSGIPPDLCMVWSVPKLHDDSSYIATAEERKTAQPGEGEEKELSSGLPTSLSGQGRKREYKHSVRRFRSVLNDAEFTLCNCCGSMFHCDALEDWNIMSRNEKADADSNSTKDDPLLSELGLANQSSAKCPVCNHKPSDW